MLWEAEKLMVKAEVEALVMVPVVEFKVVIVPLVDQKLVAVRLVDEALVIMALLIHVVPATVKLVVEALVELKLLPLKFVVPETVKSPPIYTFPEEWTERREPGLVVPIPTFPP